MAGQSTNKLLRTLRMVISVVVVIAVVVTVLLALDQLHAQPIALSRIDWPILLGAAMLYMCAVSCGGIYWHHVLRAMGQPVRFLQSYQAFVAGQLGKYVPGKAMVVVMRTSAINRHGVPPAVGATSVFVETLTWIAVGAAIGAILTAWLFQDLWQVGLLAMMAAIAASVPTIPRVMRSIVRLLRIADQPMGSLRIQNVLFGWAIVSIGWAFNGLSLWMIMSALPDTNIGFSQYGLCLACVSLSTVFGFVSLLPGGIGVRELVMVPLLGNRFGLVAATLAVILFRLISIGSELLLVAIMYQWQRRPGKLPVDPADSPMNEHEFERRAA